MKKSAVVLVDPEEEEVPEPAPAKKKKPAVKSTPPQWQKIAAAMSGITEPSTGRPNVPTATSQAIESAKKKPAAKSTPAWQKIAAEMAGRKR